MDNKKVALFGWHPDVVNFEKWGGSPEKLRAMLESEQAKLNSEGYATDILYIRDGDSAYQTVADAVAETTYDCILIGAGVRRDEEHFLVFEKLVNAVHELAPHAKICFNSNPMDTVEAVKRWI
ncbi:hypothetical protein [Grimontia marina]|uniref:Uncharacterized protein n=1 Tax=Grimontia marina TaxID=646534 RepID=A0A128F7B0_9GAMM|nr:hypothetical protein [Grimontia marina]CZF82370.1 hypothetical protein GMA8713_02199 [Grimontia marina]